MPIPAVTIPAAVLAAPFPTNADRTAGTFNAKAVDWANSENAMATRTREIAEAARLNAVTANQAATEANEDAVIALAQVPLAAAQVALAATQASNAAGSASTASTQATSVLTMDKRYLGSKASAPTLDNQGEALATGALYYDTTLASVRTWNGVTWVIGVSAVAGVASVNGLTGAVNIGGVALQGDTLVYVSQVKPYTITNFNSFTTYVVSASAGTISRTGDTVTYTAPATAQSITITVTANGNPTTFALVVLAAGVAQPTNTAPANAATGQFDSVALSSSEFVPEGPTDTHASSDWQVATDAGFTTIVASRTADAVNRTTFTVTGLVVSTQYFWRVRYSGAANGTSAYSAATSFTTAAEFNSYIATPTATPTNFGNALEGGFYAGLIWNELVQSSTSTVIGTGSRAFTVPSMTGSPIVYAGQQLEVRSRANPANRMQGTVTAASGTTLTINVASVTGSGTFIDWSIMSRYRVIVAPKASGENASVTYKNANTAAPTATGTLTEGRKAALAMVAADTATVYPAAHWCNNLSIGSRTDWYLPARDELELCWRNLKPTTTANYTTTDRPTGATPNYANDGSFGDVANTHGLNNNSAPVGAAYTASVPGQVAATTFRNGGAEAYEFGSSNYWSASEYSATSAWLQYWLTSFPGTQTATNKASAARVRAVRRSII
jgi:hypothetical protein